MAEFGAPGGIGEVLQGRLEQRALNNPDSSWLIKWWNDIAYLGQCIQTALSVCVCVCAGGGRIQSTTEKRARGLRRRLTAPAHDGVVAAPRRLAPQVTATPWSTTSRTTCSSRTRARAPWPLPCAAPHASRRTPVFFDGGVLQKPHHFPVVTHYPHTIVVYMVSFQCND